MRRTSEIVGSQKIFTVECLDPFEAKDNFEFINHRRNLFSKNRHIERFDLYLKSPLEIVYIYDNSTPFLDKMLDKPASLSFEKQVELCFQLLKGIEAFHENEIIYGNISLKNIINDQDGFKFRIFPFRRIFEKHLFPSG
jgi:serine/threonine protein kinase